MRHISVEDIQAGMTLGRSVFDSWGGLLACAGSPVTDTLVSTMKRREVQYAIVFVREPEETALDVIDRLVIDIATAAGSPDTVCHVTDEVEVQLTRLLDGGVFGHLELDAKTRRDITGIVTSAVRQVAPLFDVTVPEDDAELRDHAIMTTVLTVLYARRQRYSADAVDNIVTGALLHDCGKSVLREMGIPARLMSKHELYPEHPVFGHILAHRAGLVGDSPECEVILRHHERPDGSGFPAGFAIDGSVSAAAAAVRGGGSVIPLALLISVMNRYDNTVRASSGDNMSVHNACRELIFNADSCYHVDVVRALVEMMRLYPVGATVRITDIDDPMFECSRGIIASVDEDTGMPSVVITTDRDGLPMQPVRIDTSRLRSIGLNLEL